MEAYKQFLAKAIERYDGDSEDDMPGLKQPIKYWEVLNEPSMQGGSTGGMGEELKFFKGTPEEYLDILKTSYEVIKETDPEAQVLHAGMAGMHENFQKFWTPVFSAGAADYFDIANIHSISTTTEQEDLFVIKFKKYLESFGITDKPIWVTEVQFGNLAQPPRDLDAFHELMVKASVFSLVQGADLLFYIENWLFWNDDFSKPKSESEPKPELFEKKKQDFSDNPTQQVYLNLVDKINNYDKIETIKEEYTEGTMDHQGATSEIGQYKFINGDREVYALWGKADLPEELTGTVKVTDIFGQSQEIDVNDIILDSKPIFIEKL